MTSLWRPNIRSLPVEELSSDKVLQTWWGKDDVAIPIEKSVKLLNHDNSYYWGYWGEWVTRVTGVTRKTKFTRVTWATMLIWLNGDLNDWETLRPTIVAFHIYYLGDYWLGWLGWLLLMRSLVPRESADLFSFRSVYALRASFQGNHPS